MLCIHIPIPNITVISEEVTSFIIPLSYLIPPPLWKMKDTISVDTLINYSILSSNLNALNLNDITSHRKVHPLEKSGSILACIFLLGIYAQSNLRKFPYVKKPN